MTKYRMIAMLAWTAALSVGCSGPAQPANSRPAIAMTADVQKLPWTGKELSGEQFLTTNYRIYTTTKQQYLRDHVAGFMEAAHRNHLDLTGLSDKPLGKRMDVYLMSTRDEWADMTKSHLGAQSGPYMHIQAGGYMVEGVCVFWNIGALTTLRVASHEGLHQLFYHRLRHRPPVWLEEGLCTQAEGFQIHGLNVEFDPADNPDRLAAVRESLARRTWLPLRQLLVTDPGQAVNGRLDSAVQYYGQLWALVQFLRSRPDTREGIGRLLADAESGQLHGPAGVSRQAMDTHRTRELNQAVSIRLFEHYMARDLDRFDRDYAAFARTLAGWR